ncbi:MAG: hypothetical protein E7667_00055 [Ruminococcaceae bacterium]|nr:hypothetical protein [Oscillospiraceae bacterium]
MRNAFDSIIGNNAVCSTLSRAINSNTLAHAYIIEGSTGSGRHTLATRTIAAISCANKSLSDKPIPCGECRFCKKILENRCSDITHIGLEGDKVSIGVDAIRFLKGDIYLPPTELGVKAYIINDADAMTIQAQNAFLLSLEEPPEYVLFFLICENSSALLETVKSRAPILRMEKISASDIEKYIIENEPQAAQLKFSSQNEFNELICAADGSIGYAISLLDQKKRKGVLENRRIAREFIDLTSGKHNSEKLEIISSLGTKRQEICDRLSYIQYALRDLILLKKSEDAPLCFYSDREKACELSTHFSSKKLLCMFSATEGAISDLDKNANVRLTLINMLKNSELI